MAHDPETQALIRQSLTLIVRSEKLLTQLEDHVSLLRTFIRRVNVDTTLRILAEGEHADDCPPDCTDDHDWTTKP